MSGSTIYVVGLTARVSHKHSALTDIWHWSR